MNLFSLLLFSPTHFLNTSCYPLLALFPNKHKHNQGWMSKDNCKDREKLAALSVSGHLWSNLQMFCELISPGTYHSKNTGSLNDAAWTELQCQYLNVWCQDVSCIPDYACLLALYILDRKKPAEYCTQSHQTQSRKNGAACIYSPVWATDSFLGKKAEEQQWSHLFDHTLQTLAAFPKHPE